MWIYLLSTWFWIVCYMYYSFCFSCLRSNDSKFELNWSKPYLGKVQMKTQFIIVLKYNDINVVVDLLVWWYLILHKVIIEFCHLTLGNYSCYMDNCFLVAWFEYLNKLCEYNVKRLYYILWYIVYINDTCSIQRRSIIAQKKINGDQYISN